MPTFAETADRITAEELYRRGSVKWTRGGPGAIGAFVAEMDFGAAPAISEALRELTARADFGYLSEHEVTELAQACAAWQHDSYGWTVDPARVRPLPDVIKGLEAAITVFSRPGAPVILPTPAYMPFLTWPARLGREIIQVPMTTSSGRPALDLAGLDAAFRRGGHLLILCNPCNPVGRVYTKDELAGLLADYLPGIGYQPPEGTYLAWLDCRDLVRDRGIEVSPAEFFRARARVLLTDGAACGEAGRGHVRLNFATPRPILTEIVRRMAEAVQAGGQG